MVVIVAWLHECVKTHWIVCEIELYENPLNVNYISRKQLKSIIGQSNYSLIWTWLDHPSIMSK